VKQILRFVKRRISNLTSLLPPNDERIYQLCQRYIDRYNNENNGDITNNGELRFISQVLPYSKVVFDVGANVGDWAIQAIKVNSNIELHCFEPGKDAFLHLKSKGLGSQTVINNAALGSEVGTTTLYIYAPGSGMNSLYVRRGLEDGWGISPQERFETININTVDNYCKTHSIHVIDFMKIDVEGHELEVLKGAHRMLATTNIKMIQFEYGGANIDAKVLLKDIFEFFEPFSYSFFKLFPAYLKPVKRYSQKLENFQYQNWAIISNDYVSEVQ
jgi:FkbM family methyltransferase